MKRNALLLNLLTIIIVYNRHAICITTYLFNGQGYLNTRLHVPSDLKITYRVLTH